MKNNPFKRNVLVALTLILAAIFFAPWIAKKSPFSLCIFHKLTGYLCPLCGGTRALAALGKFEFREAILLNPLVVVVCLTALIILPAQMFSEKMRSWLRQWPLGRIFLILLLLNWLYLILAYKF